MYLTPSAWRGFFIAPDLAVGGLGQLVEVQGEEGHCEAAEQDEQVLGGEGQSSRYKTLLTNVTESQGCVIGSFRGGCGQSSFLRPTPLVPPRQTSKKPSDAPTLH